MTINSTTRKAGPFTGNGSATVFPFTFKVFTAADIEAVRLNVSTQVETVLALGTDYTVTLNADQDSNPGGSITLPSVLATGYNLVITSDIGNLQPTDLTNQGGFYPDVINDSLDRATIQIQQLQEAVDRSAKLPITSSADADALVADIVRLADSADNIDTVASSITNVNTTATNIAAVNTVATNIASVNTVSTNIANVNTAASNIAAINAAPGYASDAAASAILANDWATKTSGPVAGGEYSAKYNAQQAASSSSSASTSASNAATSASDAATSASSASTSATNANNSASAASASAAAAAAAAASGLYRQVLDKSANYTIVAADQGTLFRGNTGSGAITFTLPLISSVSDGFKVSIVKWTSDANPVNISRSGSDTINGATSAQIGSQYSQIILVADFETNTWFASQSGLGATNMNVDVFSGNGSTTAFTLSSDPGSKNNTDIFIGGVHQDHSTYSTSGTTLTFSTAPPSGTSNIEVCYGTPLPIGTPSDGTVSASKIAANAVDLTTKVTGTLPVANGGTGASTLAANNVLLGNGTSALQAVAPGTSGNVLTSNGTTWQSSAPTSTGVNVQTFTGSGTWTKPSGYAAGSRVFIQAWGGGASGGKLNGCGGGGGGYNERWLNLSQMGATETITIGAGGNAKTTNGIGNAGGNTTAGSLITAYGGGGGQGNAPSSATGGGGGGQTSAGSVGQASGIATPGKPWVLIGYDGGSGAVGYQGAGTDNTFSGNCDALYHGGGGANIQVGVVAGVSVWGGGGGGAASVNTAGGASRYAGSGGAGGTAGTAGTQPGGGGGGSSTGNSGAGGDGQVIITVFPA